MQLAKLLKLLQSTYYMKREEYFKDMKAVGEKSLSYLDKFLKSRISDKELLEIIMLFLKRRKDAVARPWIVKNSFSFFSKSKFDLKKCLPISSIAELENTSNYQSNAVYDNKYIIKTEKDKVLQILASFITRDLVDDLIFEEYKEKVAVLLSKVLRKIDYYNQIGQYKEFRRLFYEEDYNFENLGDYTLTYLEKAMYYGGAWMGGLILAGAILHFENLPENKDLQHLVKYGVLTGTAMNIINDISDYALFENEKNKFGMHYKKPEDQFKDIENKRILIPLYYTLFQAKRKSKKDFDKLKSFIGKELSIKEKNDVFNLMKKYNGLSYTYSIAKILNNRALKELEKVSDKTKEIELFKILSSMVENNKFLYYYRSKDALKKVTINPIIKKKIKSHFFYDAGVANGMALDFFVSLRAL